MSSPRLSLPAACIDPAFLACLGGAINTPELSDSTTASTARP